MKKFATLVLLGICACSSAHNGSSFVERGDKTAAAVGRPAPEWEAATTAGPTLALSALRGKAVYLNFFASWCPPCNEEAPSINALQRQYASRGFQVVGVDVLENPQKATSFVTKHHLIYPAVIDDGVLRDQYNVNGLPVHVFIDRTGIIRQILIGELSPAQIESNIKAIL